MLASQSDAARRSPRKAPRKRAIEEPVLPTPHTRSRTCGSNDVVPHDALMAEDDDDKEFKPTKEVEPPEEYEEGDAVKDDERPPFD